MGDEDAVFPHQLRFLPAAVDAVGHDAGVVAAEQAVAVIGLAVESRAGAKLPHPGDLTEILRKMALDGQMIPLRQTPQALQQLVSAGGHETGRQDGHGVGILLPCFADPALRVRQRGRRAGLAEIFRAVAVHIDLAYVGDQAALLHFVHQQLRRRHVDGAENGGAGGGAAAQMVGKNGIGPVGVGQIGVFGFLGEGVGVQPVQQLHVHAQTPEGKLGRVEMEVRQAGNDESVTVVRQREVDITLRQRFKHTGTAALLADKIALGHQADAVAALAPAEVAPNDKITHTDSPHRVISKNLFY